MTGATGFLGRELAEALLAEDPEREIWAIVREAPDRVSRRLPASSRVHVVGGDVELPQLGCDGSVYPRPELPDAIDACFHLAARTEFKESDREGILRANVDGTRHLVGFLKRLGGMVKLYHVSTAYVSGLAAGVVDESLHHRPPGFANVYEESKHAAELVVSGSGLDWTILRPSILMGHSITGEAESDRMVYGVLKTYWRLREVLRNKYSEADVQALARDPFAQVCRPEVAKNLLCLDDAVRLMLAVAGRRPATGTIFHLVNPWPSSVGSIIGSMLSLLGLECLVLDPRPPERPRVEEQLIQRGTRVYRPYMLNDEATFDQARLRELLGDVAVEAVLPMTAWRLHFLFERYLQRELEAGAGEAEHGPCDRLAAVRQHGRGILAYSSVDGRCSALPLCGGGFVPYAVKGRTAAMIGGPVCAPERLDHAVGAFLEHCRARAYRAVAVQASRRVADALARSGAYCNRMGDEAVVDLPSFDVSLAGRPWEKLRRHRNAARAGGVTVREGTYLDVPAAIVDRVSRSWLTNKLNQRELAFLLRPLPLEDEPQVRKLFAFRGKDLVGFVIFDPLYEGGVVSGYYADVERYERWPNGIHDLILLQAIEAFRSEGLQVLSLGLAPLFHLDQEDHPTSSLATADFLRRMRDETAPIYNFTGVSQHKTCYNPRWEPTYFCSQRHDGARDVLDVLSLIGLLAPEAVNSVRQETFELVQGA